MAQASSCSLTTLACASWSEQVTLALMICVTTAHGCTRHRSHATYVVPPAPLPCIRWAMHAPSQPRPLPSDQPTSGTKLHHQPHSLSPIRSASSHAGTLTPPDNHCWHRLLRHVRTCVVPARAHATRQLFTHACLAAQRTNHRRVTTRDFRLTKQPRRHVISPKCTVSQERKSSKTLGEVPLDRALFSFAFVSFRLRCWQSASQ
jgi:hypothetical protein